MYRFLLSWRWLGALLLALAVAAGCVALGSWQWDRREQRLERNALVTGNYDREPVPLDAALSPAGDLPEGTEWTPVALTGRYLAEDGVLLRNRPLDGRPGYHQLVPLRTRDGAVVLVDRGWLPTGQTGERPEAVPAPPTGEVRLVARMRPAEPDSGRGAPAGQVQSITPSLVQLAGAERQDLLTSAYAVLGSEEPRPGDAPRLLPRPQVEEGPHLSYALQWFVFALGALGGFVVVVRRSAHDEQGQPAGPPGRAGPAAAAAPAGPGRARRRRPSDEDEEDALVDAQVREQDASASTRRAGSTPRS
ncbi:SURF1 family cytochrome oxidase biogenesis protein [Thalassiella azotivora]